MERREKGEGKKRAGWQKWRDCGRGMGGHLNEQQRDCLKAVRLQWPKCPRVYAVVPCLCSCWLSSGWPLPIVFILKLMWVGGNLMNPVVSREGLTQFYLCMEENGKLQLGLGFPFPTPLHNVAVPAALLVFAPACLIQQNIHAGRNPTKALKWLLRLSTSIVSQMGKVKHTTFIIYWSYLLIIFPNLFSALFWRLLSSAALHISFL